MSNFSRIEYPTCPECHTLINDLKIFTLWDLESQRYFQEKKCPKCLKPFLMKTRVELQTEVVAIDLTDEERLAKLTKGIP